MTEKCALNRCENPAAGSIEDDEGSFSFCDDHFDSVTSAALHEGLSLADAVDAVALAETVEDETRFRSGQSLGDGHRQQGPIPHHRLEYRLDSGREVSVEEIRITPSTLGYLAGSKDAIRAEVIKRHPERVREQFPGHGAFLIKPIREGALPAFIIIVVLVSQPVCDPAADFSSLVFSWLSDDLDSSLPELIGREIQGIPWDKLAVDGNI
jgi:hypothetical protein